MAHQYAELSEIVQEYNYAHSKFVYAAEETFLIQKRRFLESEALS